MDWWALGILLYEKLYGYTPFRGKARQKTFASVLYKHLTFPESVLVSLQAKQLMYRLLHIDIYIPSHIQHYLFQDYQTMEAQLEHQFRLGRLSIQGL